MEFVSSSEQTQAFYNNLAPQIFSHSQKCGEKLVWELNCCISWKRKCFLKCKRCVLKVISFSLLQKMREELLQLNDKVSRSFFIRKFKHQRERKSVKEQISARLWRFDLTHRHLHLPQYTEGLSSSRSTSPRALFRLHHSDFPSIKMFYLFKNDTCIYSYI